MWKDCVLAEGLCPEEEGLCPENLQKYNFQENDCILQYWLCTSTDDNTALYKIPNLSNKWSKDFVRKIDGETESTKTMSNP
jgi:hypothetical protein